VQLNILLPFELSLLTIDNGVLLELLTQLSLLFPVLFEASNILSLLLLAYLLQGCLTLPIKQI
jgi:hypothetical protein